MAFNVHNSGRFHNMPVITHAKHAADNTAMFNGYTSKLVNVTPTMVTMLEIHPISLTCFSKSFKAISFLFFNYIFCYFTAR
jgi:hypothetical protein